jgi:deoxyribonuclease V
MDFPQLHDWNLNPGQAIALQRQLAERVSLSGPPLAGIRSVAGVDVSCRWQGKRFHAAVVVLSFPELQLLEIATASRDGDFPYVPGLLSFRELPVVLEACGKLRRSPDLLLVDGQGIAHPRRFGLASHLGLWLSLPSIGCAKSRLYGVHGELGEQRGDAAPLLSPQGEELGVLLRTRDRVKPLYISPGHLLNIEQVRELVLACGGRYRLPEPIRLAHQASNRQRLNDEQRARDA